jgi:hypothetical protein
MYSRVSSVPKRMQQTQIALLLFPRLFVPRASVVVAIPTKRNSVGISIGQKSCKMPERLLKTLRNFGDFQAEYEGSIPFTRSNFLTSVRSATRAHRQRKS